MYIVTLKDRGHCSSVKPQQKVAVVTHRITQASSFPILPILRKANVSPFLYQTFFFFNEVIFYLYRFWNVKKKNQFTQCWSFQIFMLYSFITTDMQKCSNNCLTKTEFGFLKWGAEGCCYKCLQNNEIFN